MTFFHNQLVLQSLFIPCPVKTLHTLTTYPYSFYTLSFSLNVILCLKHVLSRHNPLSARRPTALLPFSFHLKLQKHQLYSLSPYPQSIHSSFTSHNVYPLILYPKSYPNHFRIFSFFFISFDKAVSYNNIR